jgi:predicted O-methyltransferase YrrM
MTKAAKRLAVVERVVADPPLVHVFAESGIAPTGVWHAQRDCYEFLAEVCEPGTKTLETGLGISTVLFAEWECLHTCVAPVQAEVDALRDYCARKSVDVSRLTLHVESSDTALPAMVDDGPLDLVFIDGGHAFPLPLIDWYYAGQRLHRGGTMVIDDAELPALSRTLLPFLDADPRWRLVRATWKWRAYERLSSGPLLEPWTDQSFFRLPGDTRLPPIGVGTGNVWTTLRRARRRARSSLAGLLRR